MVVTKNVWSSRISPKRHFQPMRAKLRYMPTPNPVAIMDNLKHLARVGLDPLADWLWAVKSQTLVEEVRRRNANEVPRDRTSRSNYQRWTVEDFHFIYKVSDKGYLLESFGSQFREICDPHFKGEFSEGYIVEDCTHKELQFVFKFILAILTPDKVQRISGKMGATVITAWDNGSPINWAHILHDRFIYGCKRVLAGRPTFVSPFLFHIYKYKGLLTPEEIAQYENAVEESAFGVWDEDEEEQEEQELSGDEKKRKESPEMKPPLRPLLKKSKPTPTVEDECKAEAKEGKVTGEWEFRKALDLFVEQSGVKSRIVKQLADILKCGENEVLARVQEKSQAPSVDQKGLAPMQTQLRQLGGKNQRLEGENKSLKKRVSDAEQELTKLQKKLQEVASRSEGVEEEKKLLKKSMSDFQEEVQALHAKLLQAGIKNEALEEDKKLLRRKLTETKQALDDYGAQWLDQAKEALGTVNQIAIELMLVQEDRIQLEALSSEAWRLYPQNMKVVQYTINLIKKKFETTYGNLMQVTDQLFEQLAKCETKLIKLEIGCKLFWK